MALLPVTADFTTAGFATALATNTMTRFSASAGRAPRWAALATPARWGSTMKTGGMADRVRFSAATDELQIETTGDATADAVIDLVALTSLVARNLIL